MVLAFRNRRVSPDVFGWGYPWTLPINVRLQELYDSHNTMTPAVFGGLAGIVAAPLASWDLGRRDEHL